MPSLTQQEPDTIDLDYFYAYFSTSFGIAFLEDESTDNIKLIPPSQEPTVCHIKTTRTTKATHFFRAPKSTSTITCLCNKYHTQFIAKNNPTYQLASIFSQVSTGKNYFKKLSNLFSKFQK